MSVNSNNSQQQTQQPQQFEICCLIIGPASSGKTTLMNRLVYSSVTSNYNITTRITCNNKSYIHPKRSATFEILYIDCPGKTLYEKLLLEITKKLAPKCMIVGVYDVTNRNSLLSLEETLTKIQKLSDKPLDYDGILLGNKIDLVDKRIISASEGQQKARMFKYRHFECSARDDLSIDEFHQLVIDSLDSKLFADANLEMRKISVI